MRNRKSRRAGGLQNVPVSAMIDIVFLLIIFFVVTIDIERDAADQMIVLPTVNTGTPIRIKKGEKLTVNIRGNGDMTIDGQIISLNYLKQAAQIISEKWGNNYSIIIRGDKSAEFRQTNKAIKIFGDIGFTNVSFCAEIKGKNI